MSYQQMIKTGVTDDEDFQDQEDMEEHGGQQKCKEGKVWQVLPPRKSN